MLPSGDAHGLVGYAPSFTIIQHDQPLGQEEINKVKKETESYKVPTLGEIRAPKLGEIQLLMFGSPLNGFLLSQYGSTTSEIPIQRSNWGSSIKISILILEYPLVMGYSHHFRGPKYPSLSDTVRLRPELGSGCSPRRARAIFPWLDVGVCMIMHDHA